MKTTKFKKKHIQFESNTDLVTHNDSKNKKVYKFNYGQMNVTKFLKKT